MDDLEATVASCIRYEHERVEAALEKVVAIVGFHNIHRAKLAIETRERAGLRFHLKAIVAGAHRIWEGAYEEEQPLVFTWRERWVDPGALIGVGVLK